MVKAVRDRANALSAAGRLQCVEIDILGAQSLLDRDVAVLKSEGHLHQAVHVGSVLNVLDRSGSETIFPVVTGEEEGVVAYEADDTGLAYRLFRNGLMERYVRFSLQGHPEIVDHFSVKKWTATEGSCASWISNKEPNTRPRSAISGAMASVS